MLTKIIFALVLTLGISNLALADDDCHIVAGMGNDYHISMNGPLIISVVTNGAGWDLSLDVGRLQSGVETYVYKELTVIKQNGTYTMYDSQTQNYYFSQESCEKPKVQRASQCQLQTQDGPVYATFSADETQVTIQFINAEARWTAQVFNAQTALNDSMNLYVDKLGIGLQVQNLDDGTRNITRFIGTIASASIQGNCR